MAVYEQSYHTQSVDVLLQTICQSAVFRFTDCFIAYLLCYFNKAQIDHRISQNISSKQKVELYKNTAKTEFPTNERNINKQRQFKLYNQHKMQQNFENKLQPVPSNLLMSFDPEHEQTVLDNHSYFTQKISPTHSIRKHHEKDLSVRSISTSKKPQFFKLPQRSPFEIEHQQTHISEQARHNYEEIQRILKNQNNNLKQQNEHLLRQISRLKQINKKYKETCFGQRIQLQGLKQECEAQKHRADQMKQIILARLKNLESKALGDQFNNLSDSAVGILEGLSLSESGVQQSS